jgi:hypothetical protein
VRFILNLKYFTSLFGWRCFLAGLGYTELLPLRLLLGYEFVASVATYQGSIKKESLSQQQQL